MKKPQTFDELIADKNFKRFLDDEINDQTHRRNEELRTTESDSQMHRNAFTEIDEQGNMNVEYLTSEFALMTAKKSKLSARARKVVSFMVRNAVLKTIEFYEK